MVGDFLEPYPQQDTVCHRLPVVLKLGLTLAVILAANLIPLRLWPLHGCLACVIFVALSVAEIPMRYLMRRLKLLLPPLLLIALSVPLSQGFSRGWDLAASIMIRATVSLLAGLWLVNTTPFERLVAALQRLRVPRVLILMLAFMYRYIFVLFAELARMRAAQRARTFGPRPYWGGWIQNARLLAALLIRAMSRADRIHGAMCARGWRGEVHLLDDR